MHKESENGKEISETHHSSHDNRKRIDRSDGYHRRDYDSGYRDISSRRDEGRSSGRWESSRGYSSRGKPRTPRRNTRSDSRREYRPRSSYGKGSGYQREYYGSTYNRDQSNDDSHSSSYGRTKASGGMSYNSDSQQQNKDFTEEAQSEWSLHATGRYYVSNSSPWCYSQEFGYFYFGQNGEIIYQKSLTESNASTEEKGADNQANSTDATSQTKPNAGSNAGMIRKAVERARTDPFLSVKSLRNHGSEVVAQAIALSSFPLPESHEISPEKSSHSLEGSAASGGIGEKRKYRRSTTEERNYGSSKRVIDERNDVFVKHTVPHHQNIQARKDASDIALELPSKEECILSSAPSDEPGARPSCSDNAPAESHSEKESGESFDHNIFDASDDGSKPLSHYTDKKSRLSSDTGSTTSSYHSRHRSTGYQSRNANGVDYDEGMQRSYYADLGAYYGYHCWDEEQKKYIYVPPEPPNFLHGDANSTNGARQGSQPTEQKDSIHHWSNKFHGNSVLKLVVLDSPKFSSGSVAIVEPPGLTVGRSASDGKNRLVIRDIEISRTHCSIRASLLFTSEDPSKSNDCLLKSKNDNDTSSNKNYGTIDTRTSEHNSTYASESGEIHSPRDLSTRERLPDRSFTESFFLVDLGSTRGTYLNDERLSASKIASSPKLLKHKDVVRLGNTKFEVHIHPEWPCDKCCITGTNLINISTVSNPKSGSSNDNRDSWVRGEEVAKSSVESTKISLEKARLLELKRLKKRILSTKDKDQSGPPSNTPRKKYVDRAAIRRSLYKYDEPPRRDITLDEECAGDERDFSLECASLSVDRVSMLPSSCPPDEIADASPDALDENTGSKILKRMGWTEGQGLGAKNSGTTEPVSVTMRVGRAGLGSSQAFSTSILSHSSDLRLSKDRFDDRVESVSEITKRRARERFFNI